ncbi:hypothetical protein N7468_009909 [Penicillium chermesinum]|uniref:Uncharacterized protein n=1 Tax=Penicillium chermesinum TaxID=63820 RepID=A0A9W9NBP6_9EURO|nr:uncharacterized protein N7468_009909 [Penicillium chermesinum]KAJ5216901.1 hypothetical protein N7468_009909 [Penicillium chermesinum]
MLYSTASISCAIKGTTYASCHAIATITVQGTLESPDLNWMRIPLTQTLPLPTESPASAPGQNYPHLNLQPANDNYQLIV